MEMVDVVAVRNFINNRYGSINRKQRLRVPKSVADDFIKLGLVQLNPMMAVCRKQPQLIELPVDGGGELSASLPVAQVLPKKTAILLQAAHCGSASQSMILGNDSPQPMLSMPVMEHGGKSTMKKLKKSSKEKDGLKTIKPQFDLDSTELEVPPSQD